MISTPSLMEQSPTLFVTCHPDFLLCPDPNGPGHLIHYQPWFEVANCVLATLKLTHS